MERREQDTMKRKEGTCIIEENVANRKLVIELLEVNMMVVGMAFGSLSSFIKPSWWKKERRRNHWSDKKKTREGILILLCWLSMINLYNGIFFPFSFFYGRFKDMYAIFVPFFSLSFFVSNIQQVLKKIGGEKKDWYNEKKGTDVC